MSDIVLVKQHAAEIPKADADAARRVLFGMVDGLGDRGKKQWRRFFNMVMRLEPGEMVEIKTHKARLGWYHRKHMKLEQSVFEAQERFEHFKAFRDWLKIGACFCDWYPGPKGGVIAVPRSISYDELEQTAMEQFHDDAVTFLRTPHAIKTLWPKLPAIDRELAIEAVLTAFKE